MFIPWFTIVLFILSDLCSSFAVEGQNNRPPGWINKKADIYFMLDASTGAHIVDYKKQLKFVSSLVSDMDIGHSFTRVGVGLFTDSHKVHINLTNNLSKDELMKQILTAKQLKGDTYLSRALKGIREQGLSPSIVRENVTHIAVLFTDGESIHKQLTVENATLVKDRGIFLFTVGIGHKVDKEEMRMIASDPDLDFSFYVSQYAQLNEVRAKLSTEMSAVKLFKGNDRTCGNNTKVDIVYVFDESAVGEKDTGKIKEFIQAMVNNFSMNSGNVRVGVVSKESHEKDILLGQYVTREDLVTGLQEKSGPEINELIKRAHTKLFLTENGARSDAKRRIVLILHDNVTEMDDTIRKLDKARFDGLEIFVIQMGNGYETSFLNKLRRQAKYTMDAASTNDLIKSEFIKKFTDNFCKDL